MKTIWLDVETTGVSCKRDRITEIAIIYDMGPQYEIEKFNTLIYHQHYPMDYDDIAKLTGLTREKLKAEGVPEHKAFNNLIEFLDKRIDKFNRYDKAVLAGYKTRFDESFLRELFKRNNNKFYGSYFLNTVLDVSSTLACAIRMNMMPFMQNYKLVTLAKELNIKLNAHNAASDIEATMIAQGLLECKIMAGGKNNGSIRNGQRIHADVKGKGEEEKRAG